MSHQGRLKACIIINYAVMSQGGFANSLWQACISYRKSLPLYYGKRYDNRDAEVTVGSVECDDPSNEFNYR